LCYLYNIGCCLLNDIQLTVAFALLQAPNMILSTGHFVEAHRVNQAGDKAHFRCLIAFCGFIEIYACCLAWWQYSGKMWYITQNLYYPKTRNGVQNKSASLFTSKLSVLESDHRRVVGVLIDAKS